MRWTLTDKGDSRYRREADAHYTRQTPGSPQWCRPGFNMTLFFADARGPAVFNWWRPKWEEGIARMDGLRAIECTIFRNRTRSLSSDLVLEAVAAVQTWEHWRDAGVTHGLITAINSAKTARRRSRRSPPGTCFRAAGWEPFDHAAGFADVWLTCRVWPEAEAPAPEPHGQREWAW